MHLVRALLDVRGHTFDRHSMLLEYDFYADVPTLFAAQASSLSPYFGKANLKSPVLSKASLVHSVPCLNRTFHRFHREYFQRLFECGQSVRKYLWTKYLGGTPKLVSRMPFALLDKKMKAEPPKYEKDCYFFLY